VTDTPEQVLARLDADVASLRRRGFGTEADRLAKVADEFRASLAPLALVQEHTAVARCGKSVRWLRGQHDAWCRVGAAGFDLAGNRLYRLVVLPTRMARAEGAAEAERFLKAVNE